MESALCLRRGPLSPLPLRIPSPVKPATAKVTLLSLPLTNTTTSIHRPLGHGFSPVCAINGFPKVSTNDHGDDGKQIVKGTVGASLALACVLGIISCGCKMSPPVAIAATKTQKSISMPSMTNIYPGGGKQPLKSLLDMSAYLAASQDNQKKSIFSILKKSKRIQPRDIEALKEDAIKQLKNSGKGDEVVKQLTEAYKACKGDPEPELNVQMALVEVLILLGRYTEASECKCLQRDLPSIGPSDARVPLYNAIIYTMLDKKEEARKWWKEYTRALQGGGIPFPEGSRSD